jgi:hypothetical protein
MLLNKQLSDNILNILIPQREQFFYHELKGTSAFNIDLQDLVGTSLFRDFGFDPVERVLSAEDVRKIPKIFLTERCLGQVIEYNSNNNTYSWHSALRSSVDLKNKIDKVFATEVKPFQELYHYQQYTDEVLRDSAVKLLKLFSGYMYHLFNLVYTGKAGLCFKDKLTGQYVVSLEVELLFLREWYESRKPLSELTLCSKTKPVLWQMQFKTAILDGTASGVPVLRGNILNARPILEL